MKLVHKGILLIFVPLVFELLFAGVMFDLNRKADESAMRRARAAEIRSLTDQIWAVHVNVGWQILGIQSGAGSREKAKRIADSMDPLLAKLREKSATTNDSKHVEEFADTVKELLRRELVLANSVDDDGLEIPFLGMGVLKGDLKRHLDKLERIKKVVETEADKETIEHTEQETLRRTQVRFLWLAFVLGAVAMSVTFALVFYRNIASRFAIILDNARRFSEREQLVDEIGGNDEIAELDKTFHEMWNTVEEASRRERAMIDNAVDVICSINEFGTFTAVSPAADQMWGFEAQELIGKNLADLIAPDDQESAFETLTDSRHRQETALFEARIITSNGGRRDMQWSVQWSSEDMTFFCVVHDISDRKAIERLKQDFVNMISHDLRTPLTAVRLTLELVLQGVYGELDQKGQNRIAVAQDSTQRLLELVNQLLQLEKLEAGKMELALAPFAVLPLLKAACDSVQTFAEQHQVQTAIDCSELIEAMVDGDRIVQVLINLLSNSIKFSPEKSTVTVSAKQEADELFVSVKDEGRGVPDHLKNAIFNRFEQVERNDSEQKGGTGLGLAICKAIVEAHNGQIGVESEAGKGSLFWFRVPLKMAPALTAGESVNVTD